MSSSSRVFSFLKAFVVIALAKSSSGAVVDPTVLDACPGYSARNVTTSRSGLTTQLFLRGPACNVFGNDVERLSLSVVYETRNRIHLKITDSSQSRYEVPESVFPRPHPQPVLARSSNIQFNYTASPFSFSIYRTSTHEVLFSTLSHPIIFEPQYLRVKTRLPANANIYGLGEHTNPFRLPTDNTTLTLWSRDAYGALPGTNLYSSHPVYFEHRTTGTHGVLLLNSNGMDVKLSSGEPGGAALEYNVIGGVLDFYFFVGSENDPAEVARQYAEVVGLPAEVPYWGFGFHQSRYGYKDFVEVASVISRYVAAGIPLEAMWTDIDYMDRGRIFTVDPAYFPLPKMREIVQYLHDHDQKYILMNNPAVAYLPDQGYPPYNHGKELDIWMKAANGSESLAVIWPGVAVFPDWFHPDIQKYWTDEFLSFYNPETGIDIDGVWLDMNDPANFCDLPCDNPYEQALLENVPHPRPSPPPGSNMPIFVNSSSSTSQFKQREDLLNPPYAINNVAGPLSRYTASTDIIHANGLSEYNTHNLYGTMMTVATRDAMLARRPGKRTFIITRSTFPGAGAYAGKWLGDNFSSWEHYRFSIAGMLAFASIYQVPMAGSDICGYGGNTTENLCARWASLGAFYPFMRNHDENNAISQEFYLWPTVEQAAKSAIDIRYRLMDYIYTAFHQSHIDGTPVLHPLWFKYPKDSNTFAIEHQFFYGDSILVSPVTDEGATSVSIYLPHDIFYDFATLAPLQGTGSSVTLTDIDLTKIPVHIKGGAVLPLRIRPAMTTTLLRLIDFEFVVAPDARGTAAGCLYIDDGESIVQQATTEVAMEFCGGRLTVSGLFGYTTGVKIERVRFLGVARYPGKVFLDGRAVDSSAVVYHPDTKVLDVTIAVAFEKGFIVQLQNQGKAGVSWFMGLVFQWLCQILHPVCPVL